jgi:hypothetical protein
MLPPGLTEPGRDGEVADDAAACTHTLTEPARA